MTVKPPRLARTLVQLCLCRTPVERRGAYQVYEYIGREAPFELKIPFVRPCKIIVHAGRHMFEGQHVHMICSPPLTRIAGLTDPSPEIPTLIGKHLSKPHNRNRNKTPLALARRKRRHYRGFSGVSAYSVTPYAYSDHSSVCGIFLTLYHCYVL